MCSNRLQLNALKTELIWCAAARCCHHIPDCDIEVGQDSVHPVQSARDFGVYVDGGMTMRTHINHVLSPCCGPCPHGPTTSLSSDVVEFTKVESKSESKST